MILMVCYYLEPMLGKEFVNESGRIECYIGTEWSLCALSHFDDI